MDNVKSIILLSLYIKHGLHFEGNNEIIDLRVYNRSSPKISRIT